MTGAGHVTAGGICIRPARAADAAELLKIYEPYVRETAVTFEYEVPSEEAFADRIRGALERFPYLVAADEDGILGYAYADAFKGRPAYGWAVETSIYVKRGKGRKGIGGQLYRSLESILKAQHILNLNACIACPSAEDEYLTKGSIEFHKRMGYQMVGEFHQCGYKFHRWYNMVWMEKHIGEHLPDQPPVIPFSRLSERRGC